MGIQQAVDKILKEGIPFVVVWDLESTAYLALGLFVALFLALVGWTLAQKMLA